MSQKTICVIIPTLNEVKTIESVIDEIPRLQLESLGYAVSIVVVDTDSTDGTKQASEARGVTVISEPRKGKGRAITTAFASVNGDFIFILDADYTYPGIYIPKMLLKLESGFDVVLGSRLKGKIESGAMARLNFVGNHILTLLANLLYGTHISDLCTGYWGFRGKVVRDINLNARGFDLEANLLSQVAHKRCRIAEVPIHYRRRPTVSKMHPFRDGFRIARTLVKLRFRRG